MMEDMAKIHLLFHCSEKKEHIRVALKCHGITGTITNGEAQEKSMTCAATPLKSSLTLACILSLSVDKTTPV